jgi:hypothetical protein
MQLIGWWWASAFATWLQLLRWAAGFILVCVFRSGSVATHPDAYIAGVVKLKVNIDNGAYTAAGYRQCSVHAIMRLFKDAHIDLDIVLHCVARALVVVLAVLDLSSTDFGAIL